MMVIDMIIKIFTLFLKDRILDQIVMIYYLEMVIKLKKIIKYIYQNMLKTIILYWPYPLQILSLMRKRKSIIEIQD